MLTRTAKSIDPVRHEYTLRGSPSLQDLRARIQADFLFYEPNEKRDRLEYRILFEGAIYFRVDAKAAFEEKGARFAAIREPKSIDDIRVPFGHERLPMRSMLAHMQDMKKVGSIFVPKFVIANIAGLTYTDLFLASFSSHTLSKDSLIDHLNRHSQRRFDESSLVSVYYIAGFDIEDEASVPDPETVVYVPVVPAPQPPIMSVQSQSSYEPPRRRKTVRQLQQELRMFGKYYWRD